MFAVRAESVKKPQTFYTLEIYPLYGIVGASKASPYLVINAAILSVCLYMYIWTSTIFAFEIHDPLPTYT